MDNEVWYSRQQQLLKSIPPAEMKFILEGYLSGSAGPYIKVYELYALKDKSAQQIARAFRVTRSTIDNKIDKIVSLAERNPVKVEALSPGTDIFSIPIGRLFLTARAYNCLLSSGLHTIRDVVALGEQELLKRKNLGRKSCDEIKAALRPLLAHLLASTPDTVIAEYLKTHHNCPSGKPEDLSLDDNGRLFRILGDFEKGLAKTKLTVSKQNETLGLLRSYPPGQIYVIAPKEFVVRGFDYYRAGNVLSFKWSADQAELTAEVRGSKTYFITISANGSGLEFHCDCPAWTPRLNCKHVICTLATIKNLLDPAAFKAGNGNEGKRGVLLEQLYAGPRCQEPAKKEKAESAECLPEKQKPEYSIVINMAGSRLKEMYVKNSSERLGYRHPSCPYELRRFIPALSSYMLQWDHNDLDRFLDKYGNKYPFILETGRKEQHIEFEEGVKYKAATTLDAYPGSVVASKIFTRDGKEIPGAILSGNYLFDIDNGKFSRTGRAIGWQLWEEIDSLRYTPGWRTEQAGEKNSFSMPLEMFQAYQFVFPSSEGDTPYNVKLKAEGKEAPISKPEPSYRLTISQAPGKDFFTMQAGCRAGEVTAPPTAKLFGFLSFDGTSPAIRAHKRREILYKVFFGMLAAGSVASAEKIMKKELSAVEFRKRRIKEKATGLLRRHLASFYQDERQMLLHGLRWISVPIDKKKELSLYKVPYEIFGREIFRGMKSSDIMTVSHEKMSEGLPLLYERLKKEGIELFLEHKPVKTSSWEFAFDATRPANLDWFEIRPEIRCNGKLVDEQTWQKILAGRGVSEADGCVRILDANSQKVFRIIADIYKTAGKERIRKREVASVSRLQIFDWIMLRNSGVKVKLPPEDEQIINRLAAFEKLEPKPLPSKLKARLRGYQRQGYSWLSFLYENRFGACLADDMGLGKTIQAISLLAGIKEGRVKSPGGDVKCPHLVVLPPSLLFNWENEIKRFYPGLRTVFYTGKDRNTRFDGHDIVLTTYGLVRMDIEKLKDIQFDVIVFDEAQAVKNIFADVTGAARQLKGGFKLAMTGTPLENHIGEYYSIIDLAVPGLMGEYDEFSPLIKKDASPAMDRIIRRTKPFVLRRTKEKILKELPPKTERDIYLDLTGEQKALYRKTVEQVKKTIDQAYVTKTRQQAQIIALTAILKLRQLCVSPRLLSPEFTDQSPKIAFLLESLRELLQENHSALVFSQFTSFLDILGEDLKKQGIEFLRLDGSTPTVKRKKLVEMFQAGESPSIFLLSLKAGGQGLNLTKASYVFHLDPWWNPAVENQASDRTHRIGQKKNVTITRLLMRHTIEEKMMELKKRKLDLYKAVIENSAQSKRFSITKSDFNFLLE